MADGKRKDKSGLQPDQVRELRVDYDYYAALDDGSRYELVDGMLELISPGPNVAHQMVLAKLFHVVMSSCERDFIILTAPLDVILSPTEVRQPDLVASWGRPTSSSRYCPRPRNAGTSSTSAIRTRRMAYRNIGSSIR